jgi:hypothetical protein
MEGFLGPTLIKKKEGLNCRKTLIFRGSFALHMLIIRLFATQGKTNTPTKKL